MKFSLILSRLFSIGLACFGLILLLGGAKLLSIGGSAWYAITGAALIASAALLWFGSRWGSWLYGFVLIYTLFWSFWEVGFNGWALLPRLLILSVLGLWFLTPFAQRGISSGPPSLRSMLPSVKGGAAGWIVAISLGVVVAAGLALTDFDATVENARASAAQAAPEATAGEWRNYGNDTAGTRYSELAQITPSNVARLKLAWSFNTGDSAKPGQIYNFENTPLKIGRLLYLCSPSGQVFALDGTSGKKVWHFDPKSDTEGAHILVCRGVSYYDTGVAAEECAQRIYVATPDAKLWGVDALTGKVCEDFGAAGAVDLAADLAKLKRVNTWSRPRQS